jgi:hypothetical protein
MVLTRSSHDRRDEGSPLNAILSLPSDAEAGVSLLQVNRLRITIPSQGRSQLIGDVQQPGVSGIGGKQDQLTESNHPSIMLGSLVLDVTNFLRKAEAFPRHPIAFPIRASWFLPLLSVLFGSSW